MSNLKNFFNEVSQNNRIYSAEDIGDMSLNEFSQNEEAINYQMNNLGVPRQADLIANSDVVYVQSYTRDDGTKVKAHYRSKPDEIVKKDFQVAGTVTGAASNLMGNDKEFDRNINYQFKGNNTNIPNLQNYIYYNELCNKLDQELGDFLNKNTNVPRLYSNDIRHQYVSAIFARNLGEDQAKWLGDLNEMFSFGRTASGKYDTKLDILNNEIGRNYAKKYPNVSREQLLEMLFNDYVKNKQYTRKKLNN